MPPACVRALAAILVLASPALLSAQLSMGIVVGDPQSGPPQRPPMRVGTGLVLGRVLEGSSTTPVADALVTLTIGGSLLKVITDGEGRFLFTRLPDGPAHIVASKNGYLDGRFGQRSPRGPGRLLTLAERARVGDAVVRLWRLAGVSGAVHDESGDPAVGVEVRLIDRAVGDAGARVLAPNPAAVAITDDRGMYRFAGVAPGDYVVMARSPSELAVRVLVSLAMSDPSAMAAVAQRASSAMGHVESLVDIDSTLRIVAPVFHGGAAPGDAQPIRVRAGEERRGVDVGVAAVPVARVGGTLFENGKPVPQIRVRLTIADSDIEIAGATSDQNGQFTIAGVPSGVYTLLASRDFRNQNAQKAAMAAAGGRPPDAAQPVIWARQQVVAGSAEATSLALAMQPGPRIRGRVEFLGGAARPTPDELARLRISLVPSTTAGTTGVAHVNSDGTFETNGLVPARYRLDVMPLQTARPWRAVSATVGATDLLDDAVTVDADLEDVVILMTTDPAGRIDGTVVTPRGAPDPAAVVVVLPADPDRFTSRRTRTVYTNANGTFTAANLPAGDYVVAVSSDEQVEYGLDRDAILRLTQSGTRVTIGDGDRRSVDLRSGGF